MTETIEGFECERHDDVGVRQAVHLQSGIVATYRERDFTLQAYMILPAAVLYWLIKPQLRSAYAQGWSDRNGQLDGATMPRIYEDE